MDPIIARVTGARNCRIAVAMYAPGEVSASIISEVHTIGTSIDDTGNFIQLSCDVARPGVEVHLLREHIAAKGINIGVGAAQIDVAVSRLNRATGTIEEQALRRWLHLHCQSKPQLHLS